MVLFRWFMIATCALLVCTLATAQIQLEDREILGKVGLTNARLAVPDVNPGLISAPSIGLADPFNNTGVAFGGTPQERDYSVVVQAYDMGQYWLSAVLQLGRKPLVPPLRIPLDDARG